MEQLLTSFESMAPPMRLVIFLSGMLFFYILEGLIPTKAFGQGSRDNIKTNLGLMVIAIIVNLGLAFLLVGASDFAAKNSFGIFHMWDGPFWAKVVIGFFVLDLIENYIPHVLDHKVPLLWRFHAVHHSDTELGITTTLRQHPGQSLFHIAFAMVGIVVVGASLGFILFYQTLRAIWGQFNHSNIDIPEFIEKPLSMVLVTPKFHKSHHHYAMPVTDSNYGGIFSIYDRIFGTHIDVEPEDVSYGVDTFMESGEKNKVMDLLLFPFKKSSSAKSETRQHSPAK